MLVQKGICYYKLNTLWILSVFKRLLIFLWDGSIIKDEDVGDDRWLCRCTWLYTTYSCGHYVAVRGYSLVYDPTETSLKSDSKYLTMVIRQTVKLQLNTKYIFNSGRVLKWPEWSDIYISQCDIGVLATGWIVTSSQLPYPASSRHWPSRILLATSF